MTQFMTDGCTCGRACVSRFSEMQILCFELTREELDMVLLGQVHAFMNASETCGDDHKAMRERSTMVYIHSGVQICSYVFLFLHGVGDILTIKHFKLLQIT